MALWYHNLRKAVFAMRKTMMIAVLIALGLFGFGSRALAEDPQEVTGPVPWVSDVSGKANSLLLKQSDTDWFEATQNTPIGEGDMVWQDQGGESEIYVGQGTYLRLGEDSGVQFTKLADDEVRVTLTKGKVVAASGGAPLMLDIPGQTVVLNTGDRARVDVADDGASRVTASGGKVEVDGPRGRFNLNPGQSLSADASGDSVQLVRSSGRDQLDKWSDQRDQQLAAAAPPPAAVAGYMPEPAAAEMAANGVWVNDPTYGYVWRPRVVVGWTPYRDGRWVWRPAWGWTWVSYEPWGWYPYHYGRWVLVTGGWVWAPVHVVHTHWSPALVFWVEGPDYIAWQPIPYDVVTVGVFFSFGPSHYDRYIDHRCMTVVRYNDFGRGHYGRYVRPWPGNCGSSCKVVRNPYREISRHLDVDYNARTPRPNGYVSRDRRPSDTRVYAHNRPVAGSRDTRVARVDYGSRAANPRNNDVRDNPRSMTGKERPEVNNGRAVGNNDNRPTVNGRNTGNTGERQHPTVKTRTTGNGAGNDARNVSDRMHPTVPSNRSYGYKTGDNNRVAPGRGQSPAVNNGNNGNKGSGRTEARPTTNYQYRNDRNNSATRAPKTETRLPMNYGRDERGNLVEVPSNLNGGARTGNGGNTATRPQNSVAPNRALSGGQRPSTHYGYDGNNGARGATNTYRAPAANNVPATNRVPAAKPAPQTRTYSAPPANTNVNRNAAPARGSYNSAPRASAPAPGNNPSRSTPAPSYNQNRGSSSSSSSVSRPSTSRSSAPARSSNSNRSSGGRSGGGRSNSRNK